MRWPLGKGGPLSSSAKPTIESVAKGTASASAEDVWVLGPDGFVAGEPHRHFAVWEQLILTTGSVNSTEKLSRERSRVKYLWALSEYGVRTVKPLHPP